jgi:hypothetical protein
MSAPLIGINETSDISIPGIIKNRSVVGTAIMIEYIAKDAISRCVATIGI